MPLVFVYETLKSDKLREKLFHREIETHRDEILNYKEVKYKTEKGSNYHSIEPKNGWKVFGEILTLTDKELNKLDKYESLYQRQQFVTFTGTAVWAYVLKREHIKGNKMDTIEKARMSGEDKKKASGVIQGSYTDHIQNPMDIRNQLSPMGKSEYEAFLWCVNKIENDLGKGNQKNYTMSDIYDEGVNRGMFYYGPDGELRVAKELPND